MELFNFLLLLYRSFKKGEKIFN